MSVRALTEDLFAQPVKADTPGAWPAVSCGPPIAHCEVAVINEAGERLPDRRVGELIVRSNCMLTEYYARPDITAEALIDGWYKTGDRGYMADGQIYISGRSKDLIIVGGKNVYPQDLEAIANEIPGIYPGRAVAFGLLDKRQGTESIGMVCELENSASPSEQSEIGRELRRQIVERTEVTLRDLRLVDQRWLIKTSSGKIARNDNREKYLSHFT